MYSSLEERKEERNIDLSPTWEEVLDEEGEGQIHK
jgi:hypothetical protein